MDNKKITKLMYIVGLGGLVGWYVLTGMVFILAFLLQKTSVTIHLMIFGELPLEFVITLVTMPCVAYTVRESIRNWKIVRRELE